MLLLFEKADADETNDDDSQSEQSFAAATQEPDAKPKKDIWKPFKKYFRYYAEISKQLSEADETWWGYATRLAPERMLEIDFSAQSIRTNSRFLPDGNLGSWIEPIQMKSLLGGDAFTIDANYKSAGFYYRFELAYGVWDWLNVFARLPVQSTESWIDFKFDKSKALQYGIRSEEDLFDLFEKLGRPRPELHHRSGGWEQGDLTIGVAWNYYRTKNVSMAVSPQILFPTGFRADQDALLIYGLGPQMDAGKNSYALGIGHGMDLRPTGEAKLMTFSLNVEYNYYFESERNSPEFKRPDPNAVNVLLPVDSQEAFFPDLTDMNSTYRLAPQSHVFADVFWGFDFKYAGLGIGYQIDWQQEAAVDSNSEEFELMLRKLRSFSSAYRDRLLGRIFLPMYHLGFPSFWAFEVGYPLSGINAYRPQDDYKGFIEFYVPF